MSVTPDVGDLIDPTAPDPTPDEVTQDSPDVVEPYADATPIEGE